MSEAAPRDLRPAEKRLDSWKEIAAYLNRGVRTIQRWEQIAGLPIHRVPHEKKGGVYAFSAELDAWWNGQGAQLANEPGAEPANRLRNRPWYIVTGTLTLTAGIVFASWALRPSSSPGGPLLKLVPFTTLPGLESFPAFSPDGSRIAFTWQRENESASDIYTQMIRAGGPPLLLSSAGTRPAWSPDGRLVSYFRNKGAGTDWDLVLTPASGRGERIIAQIPAVRYLPGPFQSWTRDGNWIVLPERTQSAGPYALTAISVINGERRRLTDPPAKSYGDAAPVISKDGRTLAFVRLASLAVGDIYVQPFDPGWEQTPAPRRLTQVGWLMRDLFWDRSGRNLLFVADAAQTRRLWKISTYGVEQPCLITSINTLGDHVVISPTGDRLIYAEIRHNLQMWRQTVPQPGKAPPHAVRLVCSTRSDANPRVSPDGKRIAFGSDRTGSYEIWVADSDGGRPVQLTALGSYSGSPRWSPEGSQIAFDTRVNGNADIYVVSVDSGKVHQLTREPGNEYVPSWSRDGKMIYFISDRSGLNQLWKMPATGGPATQITHGGAAEGIESTDGKFVYFARSFDVTSVWRVPSSGGAEEKVFDGLLFPLNFEVTADGIYYLRAPTPEDPTPALWFYSLQNRMSERVATIEKSNDNGLGMSPDGKWFIYTADERVSGDLMMIENFR